MKPVREVRNLAHLDRDTGYRWADADPILEFLRGDITDSGWSTSYLAEHSGVSTGCIRNIMNGKTRHPYNATVEAILRALGWGRPVRKISMD